MDCCGSKSRQAHAFDLYIDGQLLANLDLDVLSAAEEEWRSVVHQYYSAIFIRLLLISIVPISVLSRYILCVGYLTGLRSVLQIVVIFR